MHPLRRILPSLNSLYAIDAVGRHLSFTDAARELGLSQPAVSKSIRSAEHHLGFDLFVRRNGGLAFTEKGEDLCIQVGAVLEQLLRATTPHADAGDTRTISVSFSSSFVSMWLLPRLPEFTALHPDIAFRISENSGRADTMDFEFDFSTRLGHGDWRDVKSWEFVPEILHAVAAPDYIAAHPEVLDIGTLHKATLLHAIEARRKRINWTEWFKRAGVNHRPPDGGMVFSDYHASIQSALLGQGVALGWEHLVIHYINNDRLRFVADTRVETGQSFYLVSPANRELGEEHLIFRDWVISKAQAERRDLQVRSSR